MPPPGVYGRVADVHMPVFSSPPSGPPPRPPPWRRFQGCRRSEPGMQRPCSGCEAVGSGPAPRPDNAPQTCPAVSLAPSDGRSEGWPEPACAAKPRLPDLSGPTALQGCISFSAGLCGPAEAARRYPNLAKALTRGKCAPTFRFERCHRNRRHRRRRSDHGQETGVHQLRLRLRRGPS